MPAVVAFGRRWACGADDFVFPGLLDTTVKSCWLVSALLAYSRMNLGDFENRDKFKMYLLGMMASLVIIILTDLIAVNRSAQGSIMDTHLRKGFVPIIYLRLFWEALDTGWNTVGTLWVFGSVFSPLHGIDPPSFYFIRRYIICNWVSLIILALYFAFLYDPMGRIGEDSHEAYSDAQSIFWAKKLKTYNFILNWKFSHTEDEDKVFEAVGTTFARVLQETNFVSSDAIAGLFALYRLEEEKLRFAGNESRTESSSQVPTSAEKAELLISPVIIKEILEMEKYFPNTSRRGNWAKHLNDPHHHPMTKLWDSFKMCRGFPITEFETNGFCSRCKMSTLLTSLFASGITERDIVHISLIRNYKEVPFCIFLDHKSSSIVLTVVGIFCFSSFVTYLNSFSIPTNAPESPTSFVDVQHGLHRVAVNLRAKSIDVLETLKKNYPDYNLVLIGQSFGAGVATLLGLSLIAEFPGLRVLCLNPPGGLLSKRSAELSECFTTSVIFGNDMISRMSIPALLNLKQRVIDIIYECQTPKYKLLMGTLLRLFGFKLKIKMSSRPQTAKGFANEAHCVPVTDDSCQESNSADGPSISFFPRKILQIKTNPGDISGKKYTIQWADSTNLSKIDFLPGILSHHYRSQDRIFNALKEHLKSLTTNT